MNQKALTTLLTQTKKVVLNVGKYVEKEFQTFKTSKIETKSSQKDLVSYVDKETEKKLSVQLLKLLPESSVLGEEQTQIHRNFKYTWIIDPIDGTTNFVHGVPLFCISIGLLYQNKIILGIIYNPISKEMYYATSNSLAMLNGKKISCSSNTALSKSLVSIGLSLVGKAISTKKNQQWFFSKIPQLFAQTRGIRGIGSAALSLAWVASGRIDAYCEGGLNAWDVAGGILIVEQAGGKITNFSNGPDVLFSRECLAAGKVHSNLLKIIKS